MAKPTGGLLAFNARGSIAKTIVYSAWRGRQYVRQHVIPANPRSVDQTSTREVFAMLSSIWKLLSGDAQATWTLAAKGLPVTDRNLFVKANLRQLRNDGNTLNIVFGNGAKGGLPLASAVVTSPGAGAIDVAITEPTLPSGWSVTQEIAVATLNGAAPLVPPNPTFTEVASGPNATLHFTGLTAGNYVVTAWSYFMKADGTPAAGPQISHSLAVA